MKSFVKKWLSPTESNVEGKAPHAEPGHRVYSIGDIHGCLDLLRELHRMIEADAGTHDGPRTLIYLGDYIDRGMRSFDVINELLDSPLPGFETVHLMGNHEQTLLDFLQHPKAAAGWLSWGGRETLASYGLRLPRDPVRHELEELRDEFQSRLPEPHLAFYQGMRMMHVSGEYLFVHAGIRPGIPLRDQKNEDLLWIREDFTDSRRQHEHVVVHGHSISNEVEFFPNRIGIDTGAYNSGVLTSLVLEGEEQRLLQTGRGK